MSIDRETFDRSSERELEDLSAADHVLAFLATNDDRAFKVSEIANRTDQETGAVSTALTRLKDRSLVEYKGKYWAVTADQNRLDGHDGYARATALFNEQLGEEDRQVWRTEAPEEPHPSVSEDDA